MIQKGKKKKKNPPNPTQCIVYISTGNINTCVMYILFLFEIILNLFDLYFSSVDQEQLDAEINDLRKGLKAKVNRLNEMQGMCFFFLVI